MDGVESVLKQQGFTIVRKEGWKCVVRSKEDKLFIVEQIRKDKHVEEFLRREKHVNIVETQTFERHEETYIMMEQCSGGTLYDKIQAHEADEVPFSEQQVMAWFTKMCTAMEYLHTSGDAHGLLISQNISLTGCGTVRLGQTAELHERAGLEKPTDTNGNQPPEVRHGRPYTIHSDVYALGCLLYEMCTLENCVQVNTDFISSIRRGSKDWLINFSSGFRSLLADMLHPDPECRPSASDILKKQIVIAHITSQVGAILKELKVSLKKLNELADSVQKVHFGTTVGSLTGGVIGAAGGITSIVGLCLAPFTLGASLIVTGVGVGVAVAGRAVSGVSSITNTVSQNSTFQEIKSIITGLEEKTASVDTSIPHLIKGIESLKGVNFQNISKQNSGTGLLKGLGGASELVRLARFVSVGKSAAQLSKTVRAPGGVFAGLFVALDAVSITMDAIEINRIQQAKKKTMTKDEIKLIKSKTMKFVAEIKQTAKIQQDWRDNRGNIIDSVSNILEDH